MVKKSTVGVSSLRPPVVAVLGHVDHGKTTLLDFIRKTEVAAGEHGGITQKIGAYQVAVHLKDELSSLTRFAEASARRARSGIPDKNKKILSQAQDNRTPSSTITFIDTPGHEAFIKMRSRGASVADLAVLVVDAGDSVMPQTVESIKQIKAANIPFIVAANKIDLPTANLDKLKADLAKAGVQVEGFGGDVPLVPLSAKTGKGVPELLDLILLMAEMKNLVSETAAPLASVVIETRLDKGKGMVASVIVKKGILKPGQVLFEGAHEVAKVRALFDENGKILSEALPSRPAEVLGFKVLPAAGSVLTSQPQAPLAPQPSVTPVAAEVSPEVPDFLKPVSEQAAEKLVIILKTDTAGSLEAINASLDPRILIVGSGVGEITEADILQAKGSGAIVIGFNVKASAGVEKLAQTEKVVFRIYKIIYELLQELSEVADGLKEVLAVERELGNGQIIAEFPFDNQRIAGTKVLTGRLARGDTVKIVRAEAEITRAKIKSLKHAKDDISKAETGIECGVLFDRKVDFSLGDAIIAVTTG